MVYGYKFKLKSVKRYKKGLPYEFPENCKKATFRRKVRHWVRIYDELGFKGLKIKKTKLTNKEKLILMSKIESGVSMRECAVSVGRQVSLLSKWYKKYRQNKEKDLKSICGGFKSNMKNENKKINKDELTNKELKEKLKYLEAENEYLKKLAALVQKRKDQQ